MLQKKTTRILVMVVVIVSVLLSSTYGRVVMEASAETVQGTYEGSFTNPIVPYGLDYPYVTYKDGYYKEGSGVQPDPNTQYGAENSKVSIIYSEASKEQESEDKEPYTINTSFNMNTLKARSMLDAYVSVNNNSAESGPVLAIAALYNEENKLVNISYISKIIPLGGSETLHVGFRLPDNIQGHKVKVFVWEGEHISRSSMKPLSNVTELQ